MALQPQQIIYDLSGSRGLTDYSSFNHNSQYAAADGEYLDGVFNPFIRRGYLTPSVSTTTEVTFDQTNGDMRTIYYDNINDDLYMADDTQVFKGDGLADTTMARQVQLSGATIRDIKMYQINGVNKLFVMYNNTSGDGDIAVSNLPYDSTTDSISWLSNANAAGTATGGSNATNHFANDSNGDIFLVPADNGYAYLFMENQVHKIDGTTAGGTPGTVYPNVLLFAPYMRVVDAIDTRGLMFIAIHEYTTNIVTFNPINVPQGGECGVYIWDRFSSVIQTRDFIPLIGFRAIKKLYVSPSGSIRCIAIDTMGFTQILEYNGSNFKPIKRVSAFDGFTCYGQYRSSYCILGTMMLWASNTGVIFAHGSVFPGDPEGLFAIYKRTVNGSNFNTQVLFAAAGSSAMTSAGPVIYSSFRDSGNASKAFTTLINISRGSEAGVPYVNGPAIHFPVKFLPAGSNINYIDIHMISQGSTGSTVLGSVEIYLNQNSSQPIVKNILLSDVYEGRGFKRIEINRQYINSIQLTVTHTANVNTSVTAFMPAFAVIHYTPTTVKE